ncbi:ABC transporter ATP-binding protein [Halolamina sp. C58]|uniref:ABC transporter ATP-binding protein n=1 Tax=Halolamina sp. C58 TaxID=3421640 RepID=UPI003EC02DF3
MTPPAIETDGLRKQYGDTVALAGLDLRVERGAVYGFLGPNGAGKTTTMRLLTTLLRPSGGEAWICGEPVTDREAVAPHVGHLPERPPLYDELTGREQLRFAGELRGLASEAADRRADERLDALGLDADTDRISTYSTGMRKKLGIAQATLHEPDVLFLDEPTNGLDPRAARAVRDRLTALAADGTTVFLSTHILPVVEEVADRVGLLNAGELIAAGHPERVIDRAEGGDLEDAFLELTHEER